MQSATETENSNDLNDISGNKRKDRNQPSPVNENVCWYDFFRDVGTQVEESDILQANYVRTGVAETPHVGNCGHVFGTAKLNTEPRLTFILPAIRSAFDEPEDISQCTSKYVGQNQTSCIGLCSSNNPSYNLHTASIPSTPPSTFPSSSMISSLPPVTSLHMTSLITSLCMTSSTSINLMLASPETSPMLLPVNSKPTTLSPTTSETMTSSPVASETISSSAVTSATASLPPVTSVIMTSIAVMAEAITPSPVVPVTMGLPSVTSVIMTSLPATSGEMTSESPILPLLDTRILDSLKRRKRASPKRSVRRDKDGKSTNQSHSLRSRDIGTRDTPHENQVSSSTVPSNDNDLHDIVDDGTIMITSIPEHPSSSTNMVNSIPEYPSSSSDCTEVSPQSSLVQSNSPKPRGAAALDPSSFEVNCSSASKTTNDNNESYGIRQRTVSTNCSDTRVQSLDTSEKTDESVPEQNTPEQCTREQSTPEQSTSEQNSTEHCTTEKNTLEQNNLETRSVQTTAQLTERSLSKMSADSAHSPVNKPEHEELDVRLLPSFEPNNLETGNLDGGTNTLETTAGTSSTDNLENEPAQNLGSGRKRRKNGAKSGKGKRRKSKLTVVDKMRDDRELRDRLPQRVWDGTSFKVEEVEGIDFTETELSRRVSRAGSLGRVSPNPNTRRRTRKSHKASTSYVISTNDVMSNNDVMTNNDVISTNYVMSTNDVIPTDVLSTGDVMTTDDVTSRQQAVSERIEMPGKAINAIQQSSSYGPTQTSHQISQQERSYGKFCTYLPENSRSEASHSNHGSFSQQCN